VAAVIREERGVDKDENGQKEISSYSALFLYLFYLFPYLRNNTEIRRKAGMCVSRRDPVLFGMIPY